MVGIKLASEVRAIPGFFAYLNYFSGEENAL